MRRLTTLRRLAFASLLAAVAFGAAPRGAAAQQTAAQRTAPLSAREVLARVRAAVRYDRLRAHPHGYTAEGTARMNGVDGAYRLAFAADGRFLTRVDGPLGGATGYDGAVAWSVDWSGMPRTLELEDLDEERYAGWVYTGRWLAEEGPFDVSVLERESDAERVALSLSLRSGRLDAKLYVDRATWLPSSVVRSSDGSEETHRFERYGELDGFVFPVLFTRTIGETTDRFEVRSLTRASADDAARLYARPTERPDDTRFRDGAPAGLEVRRVASGHLLVRPLVEGKDVGWFILDSGAGAMVIDSKAAAAVGMPGLGEVYVRGVSGSLVSRFRTGKQFELGPMTVSNLRYVELDLGFLTQVFGVKIGGIAGYDLFARAVVELDLSAPSVSLHDPERYRLEGASWEEVAFSHKHPAVHARFEGGREGIFKLDTGSDQTVTFHTPAVDRLRLVEGRRTTATRAGGVGGSSTMLEGTMEWFELGGHRFESPKVGFARTTQGAFADEYLLGNIGTDFLSVFKIVFDYPGKRIAFVKLQPRDS